MYKVTVLPQVDTTLHLSTLVYETQDACQDITH